MYVRGSPTQLIHSADPKSGLVVIIVFMNVVRGYIRILKKITQSQNLFQLKVMIATGGTVDLAVKIIDDIWFVLSTKKKV